MAGDCVLGSECFFHVVVVFVFDGRGGQEEEGEGEGWGEEGLGKKGDEHLNSGNNNKRTTILDSKVLPRTETLVCFCM